MTVGFTRVFREELAKVQETRSCCRLAAAAGLLHTAGSFMIHGGLTEEERYEIRLATPVQGAAKMVYSQFKAFGVGGELLVYREPRFQRRLIYEVRLRGTRPALQVLNEMGLLRDDFSLEPGISPRLVRKGCCRHAFLRGCLIGSGSANAPQREAHLEIVVTNEALCQDLVGLLLGLDFHPGWRARRGDYVVYLKNRDEVAGLLALAGAHAAALQVEEQAVVKEVRARANRLANCDAANTQRVTDAAARQLEAIARLKARGALNHLPRALQEVAALRVSHPYLSLAELAEASEEGLTRSALNHRLRRLVEAAEEAAAPGQRARIHDRRQGEQPRRKAG